MIRIEFHVDGDPVPQGTTRAFARNGRIVTTNDPSGRLERWRGDVRTAAKAVLPPSWECVEGPVALILDLWIRRPKSHYLPVTRSRPESVLRPDAPTWHTQKPDGDRLDRAVRDALTAVVYRDDAQVVIAHVTKRWSRDPGATVVVSEVLP